MNAVVALSHPYEPITDYCSKPFKPKQIVHARLRIEPALPTDPRPPTPPAVPQMRFGVELKYSMIIEEGISEDEVADYATDLANGQGSLFDLRVRYQALVPPAPPAPPSQYDIPVTVQSWVVIELDSKWSNWQFQKEYAGCTLKSNLYPGQNCHLRHVIVPTVQNPSPIQADNPKEEGCKVIYFGVVERLAYPNGSQYVNLHTEFLQLDAAGKPTQHRLVVIFDPDVGNTGGFPIPYP